MTFEDYLDSNAGEINAYLDAYFADEGRADLRRYLYDPLSAYTSNAGKRHRPLICMLACAAVGGDPEAAITSAAAIEHFHTAALIHDDIADESLVRRGRPCMHISEGVGIAINAGDLALSSVMASVVKDPKLPAAAKLRIVEELVDMCRATIEGQALDIGWARDRRFDVGVDDYLLMARLKTAVYSGGTPLAVGAIVGGGSEGQIEALRGFGMLTGLAFQIQDDLLNLVGSADGTRKDLRSDITEGKRTYSVAHALENLGEPLRGELVYILDSKTSDPAKLERAVGILEEGGSIDAAKECAAGLISKAKESLRGADIDEGAKAVLLSMADFFVDRVG